MPTAYTMPPWGSQGDQVLGWCLEAMQEGAAWLAAQRPATNWAAAVAMMDEADKATESSSMSNTVYPKAKRIAKELVAALAGFRHEGEYKVLWDNTLYDQAHLLSDLDENWYLTTFPNEAHRAWMQNCVVKGTGYLYEEWDPHFWGPYKGDVRLTSVNPENVTFVQLPADNDIQRAYAVIIKEELPINLAKRIYGKTNPGFAKLLVPDQDTPSWLQKGLDAVQQFLSPALRVAGRTRQNTQGSFPTVNIFKMYTLDGAINEGLTPITMGAGTNWEYTVPALGSPLPTGMRNPATGEEWTKPATEADCLMFPLRRLTIFSNTGVCSDDTSPWWHGDVPLARAWFNDWPWQALGGSIIADIRTMEAGVTALMRGAEDSAAARLDPSMLYDDTLVADSWAKAVNPRLAGGRAKAPLSTGGEILKPVLPPQYYDVPPWIFEHIRAQEDRMDYLTGVHDLVAIAKAKQVPGADTLEKLMEMAGPIQQDMVRALEKPLTQLGEWRKAYYLQFYNTARVIRTVGPDVPFEPSDWTPDRLAEYLKTPTGQQMVQRYGGQNAADRLQQGAFQFTPEMLAPMAAGTTPLQRAAQMKRLMTEFRYEVTESGINEIHRMTTKLFYLQLMKEGFPISWWTFARIAKIPNFGPPPLGTNTEMERWVAQQHIKVDLQVDLQKELMSATPEGQTGPGAGGEPQPIPSLGEENRGRPQSYKRPPRLVQKDGGTRSTVTTA